MHGLQYIKDKEMRGQGRFGQVCKGMLPNSKAEVAIKRNSHESKQGLSPALPPEFGSVDGVVSQAHIDSVNLFYAFR